MRPRSRHLAPLLAAVAVAAAGCGGEDETAGEKGEEPEREGLSIEVGGLEYNVFITRQLNLSLPEDRAYFRGPDAPAGSALYGVFVQVCNTEDEGEPRTATREFRVLDTQGNEFEPKELPLENEFAYPLAEPERGEPDPARLTPASCLPTKGSLAQLGPTGGAMLLFELPLEATENRPLELEILGELDVVRGKREGAAVELDI